MSRSFMTTATAVAAIASSFSASHAQTTGSIQLFSPGEFPTLSTGCGDALAASLSCNYIETGDDAYRIISNYTTDTLSYMCTSECSASIDAYRTAVINACASDTFHDQNATISGPGDSTVYDQNNLVLKPITLPDYYFANYREMCLKDSAGDFCYIKLQADAAANDSDSPSFLCNECGLKTFQLKLEGPWSYNDDKASVYSSLTSSCGVTGMPITSPTKVIISSTSAAPSTETCTGKIVNIQPEDTCDTIAEANSISTWQLLSSNGLDGGCANFPQNGTLCIDGSCPTHVVTANDTCPELANANNITLTQLFSYNPNLNLRCSNLDQSVGHHICLDTPYNYTSNQNDNSSPTSASVAAPIPSNVVAGTNVYCGRYYETQDNDYCAYVTIKNNINLHDFYFLNSELFTNCTNLYLHYSYCVMPVGDINTYPGYSPVTATGSSATPTAPTTTFTVGQATDLDDLPSATQPTISDPTDTGYPLANGTRLDCASYDANSRGAVACSLITTIYSIKLSDFVYWNPSLSYYGCSLKNETQYCVVLGTGYQAPAVVSEPYADVPSNAATDSSTNCYFWWEVQDGDSCENILNANDISIDYYYKWNPSVKNDCTGMQLGVSYCVMGPGWQEATYGTPGGGSPTTSGPATPTSTACGTVKPPLPTQAGIPCSCNKFAPQQEGKFCYDLAQDAGITLAQFYEYNPAVGDNCQNFWAGYDYCVGVSS